jgi:hypothetical protein
MTCALISSLYSRRAIVLPLCLLPVVQAQNKHLHCIGDALHRQLKRA